jgi:hypothetical protein
VSDSNDPIRNAEAAIMVILRDLELKLGAVVDGLEVIDYDVTQIHHDRAMHLRRVVIEMRRQPGTRWAV